MTQLTPEEIERAREFAETWAPGLQGYPSVTLLARAVLALAEQLDTVTRDRFRLLNHVCEQQPEPVSEGEFAAALYQEHFVYQGDYSHGGIRNLFARYSITRKAGA